VKQADEVESIGHGRELAADSVPGKKESAIEHGDENAIEAPRNYNEFSVNGNNPLNSVSQSWGASHLNLRPPGPELGCPEQISLLLNHLSGASTVSFLLNHGSFGRMYTLNCNPEQFTLKRFWLNFGARNPWDRCFSQDAYAVPG
jgi:hypothetical protein